MNRIPSHALALTPLLAAFTGIAVSNCAHTVTNPHASDDAAIAAYVSQMQALRGDVHDALVEAEQLAGALPEGRDRVATRKRLERQLRELKALSQEGRRYLRVSSYARFAGDVARSLRRLREQRAQSLWAEQVGEVLSVNIAAVAEAMRAAYETDDARERDERLRAAGRQYALCKAAGHTAGKASNYAPSFLIETPAGRLELPTVVAACEQGQHEIARLIGSDDEDSIGALSAQILPTANRVR